MAAPTVDALARVANQLPIADRLALAAQLAREGISDLAAVVAENAALELRAKAVGQLAEVRS